MGQEEIIRLLKKRKKLLSSSEIAKLIKKNKSSTNLCLRKLTKQKLIKQYRKQIPYSNNKLIWTHFFKCNS